MVEEYLKLVNRYINGEDIYDYSVMDLENDPEFMARVLYVSKDPKMYQFASERVKRSFVFVSRVLNAFRNNYKFCQKVADYFLATAQNEDEVEDINIEMLNIARANHDIYNKYAVSVSINYAALKMEVEIKKSQTKDEFKDAVGTGFIFVKNRYKSRTKTLNYYAQKFFSDLMENEDIDICCLIKETFKSALDAQGYGTIKFITDVVSRYDATLAEYIKGAPNILVDTLKDVDKLYKDWDHFYDRKENSVYNNMLSQVEEFLKSDEDHLMSDDTIIFKAAQNLGILDKVKNYMIVPYTDSEIQSLISFIDENAEHFTQSDFMVIGEVCSIMSKFIPNVVPNNAGGTARN